MGAAELVARGRLVAESLMIDTVTVKRATGGLDPVTYEPAYATLYTGKGKVATYEANEHSAEVAGGTVTVQRYGVHVPVGSFAPEIGDVVEVVTASLDPNLAGREFVVRGLLHKSLATAYRLLVDDPNREA